MNKKIIAMLLISLVVISLIGCGGTKATSTTKQTKEDTKQEDTTKKNEPKKEDTKVTYENFLQIQSGQSYQDVIALIGEGQQTSSTETNNVKNDSYKWENKSMGSISITFQNDKVMTKTQYGLSKTKSDITKAQYDGIQNGCSYEDVKNVLGEGILTSKAEIGNHESIMYNYYSKSGGNANFSFTDNKLTMKNQANLK